MLNFEKNQIVFERKRGQFGLYIQEEDSNCSSIMLEDGLTVVRNKWLSHVDQAKVLKIIRRYHELKEAGTIELDD